MISVNQISKAYGAKKEIPALTSVDFEVSKGELFGLIGPDGSGKTTLFRILTTLILADSGTAAVAGFDVEKDMFKIRNIVGYMPGRFSLYQDLSVRENLEFYATIFNTTIEKNYHLIKDIYVQIEPFANRRAGALSGGMKQKLALCCALIHKPEVLFLDEPTTGVDVVSRKEFWEMLKRLKSEGITILVSTPYMDEAELCDRIALIDKGRILEVATPAALVNTMDSPVWAISTGKVYAAMQLLSSFEGIGEVYPFGESLHAVVDAGFKDTAGLKLRLQKAGIADAEVAIISPTIEDVFMHKMKQAPHA
ncbi:MAG: ABC transporter ATP-binding protein [Saprospiraceae bacterium]|nr:ABC transporter ATP-binding protein [Saprospiraceae bacterium]